MLGLPIAFASPAVLLALLALPVIWYLLRLTPPKPRVEYFPPVSILERLVKREETPAISPWWLTLLRLALAALLIIAMAGPIWNPQENVLRRTGPLLVVLDDGWAAGGNWDRVRATAFNLLGEADRANRPVALIRTADPTQAAAAVMEVQEARAAVEASANRSVPPDHAATAAAVGAAIRELGVGEAVFLSDGLKTQGTRALLDALAQAPEPSTVLPSGSAVAVLAPVTNNPDAMEGRIETAGDEGERVFLVQGFDSQGLPVADARVSLAGGVNAAAFRFAGPVEMRNQIVRVEIDNAANAGAVQLLDDSNRRRIIGLVSGQSADISQPLLSPLYYINRALAPFSDLREPATANLDEAVSDLVAQGVSAIILADVGRLPPETEAELTRWVEAGGMLIRFAGPRLAANPESGLLPVRLYEGDRFIGGALSWESPKTVAPFAPESPFFGLQTPAEVTVTRQVLALQSPELEARTWATLDDGTPLVTGSRSGNGWLVLFHVNSDNNWSNLPLAGTFVEMLRRIVSLSRSTGAVQAETGAVILPPLEILDGQGNLAPPPAGTRPVEITGTAIPVASLENPPGLYGTSDGYVALNLIRAEGTLDPLQASDLPAGVRSLAYAGAASLDFKPWLIAAAAMLFLLDCIAMLWFAGALGNLRWSRPAAARASALAMAGLLALAQPDAARAQQSGAGSEIDFSAALVTRIAYVVTGNDEIDRISNAGLKGLSTFIASRTALEPGEPAAVDVATDELAFYPLLYWPVDAGAPVPNDAVMARVDAYMKEGGSILFDTRDELGGSLGGNASPATLRLREILASLDIPPLEPVPPDHVLTKAFYLLDTFPGRYSGGDLWVERIGNRDEQETRPARAGDGVSTILITSNDFAGAWAVDDQLRAMFPTVPPDPSQREYAFRSGVNIMMYVLTGNYKADQVHVPALLERLGQ